MNKRKPHAPGEQRGKGLDNNFGELATNSSTTSNQKTKRENHLRILNGIAGKWIAMGCYKTPGQALQALIGGEL